MAKYVGLALRNDLKELMFESPINVNSYGANTILSPIPVKERAGYIPVLSTSAGMKEMDLSRAPRGAFNRGDWVYGSTNYTCVEKGYEEPVDNNEKLASSDYMNEEVIAAAIAMNQILIGKEIRVSNAVYNTTTFTGATGTIAITEEWDDATNAVPFNDITTGANAIRAKTAVPRKMLHLLMNETQLRNVMRCDQIRSDIKYTKSIDELGQAAQAQLLATFLGIKKVDLVSSMYDTTLLDVETATLTDIWSDEYMMLYLPSPASPSWRVPGLGRQPFWSKFSTGFKVESYDEKQTDSRIIRVREYVGEYVNAKYGFLYSNVTT